MRTRKQFFLFVVSIAMASIAWPLRAQLPPPRVEFVHGCWFADRPLGPTWSRTAAESEQAFRTFVLRDGGRIALPLIPDAQKPMWESRSYWVVLADSLIINSFTGTQGWRTTLLMHPAGHLMGGSAKYLSDAIPGGPRGMPTPQSMALPLSMNKIACDSSWPSVATGLPPLRSWQRGETVYYEQHVNKLAVVSIGSFTQGIVSARALRNDEHAKLESTGARAGIARVIMQMVVESDGRVDSAGVKVLASDGDAYTQRMYSALSQLRFQPGSVQGRPVHQLSVQRFELRR